MKGSRSMVYGSGLKYNLNVKLNDHYFNDNANVNDNEMMKVIDTTLLDKVSEEAKESPRLRMNYNFHQSLEDKCHRFLNAVELGTKVRQSLF